MMRFRVLLSRSPEPSVDGPGGGGRGRVGRPRPAGRPTPYPAAGQHAGWETWREIGFEQRRGAYAMHAPDHFALVRWKASMSGGVSDKFRGSLTAFGVGVHPPNSIACVPPSLR